VASEIHAPSVSAIMAAQFKRVRVDIDGCLMPQKPPYFVAGVPPCARFKVMCPIGKYDKRLHEVLNTIHEQFALLQPAGERTAPCHCVCGWPGRARGSAPPTAHSRACRPGIAVPTMPSRHRVRARWRTGPPAAHPAPTLTVRVLAA